ncbi:glutamyl-tRNA reductase [Halorarius halobius]|uniref:glutamyl-tRNA reductase n=1 Tax=Halorarius halobius TaxID=2962671 RepID=UPI0020CF8B7F|nr:glutamyl-tRNA reductase [Halorarius halobius]
MTGATIVSGVSVSHTGGSVEDIERASTTDEATAVERLLAEPGVDEAFVLQTCNRAEAYVVTAEEAGADAALDGYVADVRPEAVTDLDHEGSLRHLMRVAAGLESLVVGEDQILGQVRTAYETAREAGAVGPTLDDALLKALHVGERARSETAINEGVVSLGSAAVRLAAAERPLGDATGLVVGAGEMGTLAAKALAGAVDRLLVANRTLERAEHVAASLDADATALALDALPEALDAAEVVVAATDAPGHVIDAGTLERSGETFVVDLAQPRDVAPVDAGNVDVRDLDDLQSMTDETLSQRREAATEVEAMIDEEFDHLMSQYKRKRADQVIAAMYEGAERVKAKELRTAISKLESEGELTDEQRAVVESMADALVSQLLAAPTRSLRDAAEEDDWSTIHTALRLFDPSTGGPPGDLFADTFPDDLPEEMKGEMPAAMLEQMAGDDD